MNINLPKRFLKFLNETYVSEAADRENIDRRGAALGLGYTAALTGGGIAASALYSVLIVGGILTGFPIYAVLGCIAMVATVGIIVAGLYGSAEFAGKLGCLGEDPGKSASNRIAQLRRGITNLPGVRSLKTKFNKSAVEADAVEIAATVKPTAPTPR
jgi:uncharacterized membrane protein YbhN (UPF0104 family)